MCPIHYMYHNESQNSKYRQVMLKDSRGSLALPLFQQLDDGFFHALGGIAFGEIFPQGIGRKGHFVQIAFLFLLHNRQHGFAVEFPVLAKLFHELGLRDKG